MLNSSIEMADLKVNFAATSEDGVIQLTILPLYSYDETFTIEYTGTGPLEGIIIR